MFKNRYFLLCFLASTIWLSRCSGSKNSDEVYQKGTQILAQEGAKASRDFFQENALATGDEAALFGIAWSHMAQGDLIEAEEVCSFLLAQTENPEIALKCHYLFGHLMSRTGRFADAFYYFELARAGYQKSENHLGLFRTYLGLAKLMTLQKDLEAAEHYLLEAARFKQDGPDYLVYLSHQEKIAFLKKDYRTALTYSVLKLDAARPAGYRHLLADALSDHGFYLILNGEYERGLTFSKEADSIIEPIGDKDKYFYNQLNILLYRRCRGGETAPIIEEINRWIEVQGDVVLKEYLDFVLEWPCP